LCFTSYFRLFKYMVSFSRYFTVCVTYQPPLVAKFYICVTPLYGAETWTLREVDQKYLGSFEMSYWRRMDKIIWIDHVEN